MASNKNQGPLRGVALMKAAIASGIEKGRFGKPKPVPANALKKLRLPNDEKLTPALKTLLAFDQSWLGLDLDDEEPELDAMSLEDLIEQEFGDHYVSQFGEACELLAEDCVLFGGGSDSRRFLYFGTPDPAGEYPVITIDIDDGFLVCGFVPFDVWVAQHLGALPKEQTYGWVPDEYLPAVKELADSNGDGRTSFDSMATGPEEEEDDRDEEDYEDDRDEDGKESGE